MNNIRKAHLQLFLAHGLSFGLLMTCFDYMNDGEFYLLKTVFLIVFFGGFMSWSSINSMKKSKRMFSGRELHDDDFNLSHSELLTSMKSIQDIYELLKTNEATKNWKLQFKNHMIVGRTKVTWLFRGERITISALTDTISIESKPACKTTIYDNGQNADNVKLIKALIER